MTMVRAAQFENQHKTSAATNVLPEWSAQKQSSHRFTMTALPESGEGGGHSVTISANTEQLRSWGITCFRD
jgi:hypothetical protein